MFSHFNFWIVRAKESRLSWTNSHINKMNTCFVSLSDVFASELMKFFNHFLVQKAKHENKEFSLDQGNSLSPTKHQSAKDVRIP